MGEFLLFVDSDDLLEPDAVRRAVDAQRQQDADLVIFNLTYVDEEPTSLNTLELLPELMAANIASVKIEGRQRSPADL